MPYNLTMNMNRNQYSPTGLGAPGAGFATRGKASGLKRLTVASPPSIAPISEHNGEANHTPRTSRSHMLAGLRTQPKTPVAPASAPYALTQHRFAPDNTKYAGSAANYGSSMPHTAAGGVFGSAAQAYSMSAAQQIYALPEQVLGPTPVSYGDDDDLDPHVAQQLHMTEQYLAHRQMQLQQQLYSITNGAQGMSLYGNMAARAGQLTPQTPATPQTSIYYQQMQHGVSPVVQEVPGQPGLFVVFNPMTGQTNVFDAQQQRPSNTPPPATPAYYSNPAWNPDTPQFRTDVSPPFDARGSPFDIRSISPPKKTPSPPSDANVTPLPPPSDDNVTPLPPPSANAFRRGHQKKVSSLAFDSSPSVSDGPKSAFVRPVGFPATPMTGTFGPGNARAGEHPIRQPRGPPAIEELTAAPTTKHEGSKNFASRQRRGAVRSLVRAGIERRGVGRQNSLDSNGMSVPTPCSEAELVFGVASDGEDSVGSGSLSGKPSFGSLRGAASGAIGSERLLQRGRKTSGDISSGEVFSGLGRDASAPRKRSPIGMPCGSGLKKAAGVY